MLLLAMIRIASTQGETEKSMVSLSPRKSSGLPGSWERLVNLSIAIVAIVRERRETRAGRSKISAIGRSVGGGRIDVVVVGKRFNLGGSYLHQSD